MKRLRFATLTVIIAFLAGLVLRPAGVAAARHRATRSASPSHAAVGPLLYIRQTLNNCGPASIAEVLTYWGRPRSQDQAQAVVRADGSPWGMAPYAVPAYVRSVGMRSMIGVAAGEGTIKALVAHGFPVIVNQLVSLAYQVRHYRPIEAYDDRTRTFVAADPYLGPGHVIGYAEFGRIWSVSDDRFIVIYPASREHLLATVLRSAGWSRSAAYRRDLSWQRQRMAHPPADAPVELRRYYGYTSIAWDLMELGRTAAARSELNVALRQGANPVVVGWIRAEMTYRSAHGAES